MVLSAGQVLGPYEILAPLGAGGMGEVYRARDRRLKREVAVKVLPDHSASPEHLRRFEHEAQSVAALNHPHILAVHDVGRHDGVPYIVFELLEGESLRARIDRGALPPRKAVEYATQLCQGLAAAHDAGVVHRDLKPANLFLTKDGSLKILDFGLARLTHGISGEGRRSTATVTRPGTILGTVGYLSPEQAQGEAVDERSDIFAVGAILYEMLSGRRAFERDTGPETLAAVIRDDPPDLVLPSGPVPRPLERVVRRCLEKEPAERFRSARDLAFALEAFSGPASSAVMPTESRGRASLARARRVAALLVVVLAAVGGFLAGERASRRPLPTYTPITTGRGALFDARFTPDGHTVVYSASWEGSPPAVYAARVENPVPRAYDFPPGGIQSISPAGELALLLNHPDSVGWPKLGTLAVAPLAGGVPSPIAEEVVAADWAPDGSLCLIRRTDKGVRVEWPPGRVLHRPELARPPTGPRVSPRGGLVAVRAEDGRLVLLDREGGSRVLWGGDAWGHAWAPGGDELWFTTYDGPGLTNWTLRAVDLAGRERVVHRFDSPAGLADISRDGRVLVLLWRNVSGVEVVEADGVVRQFPPGWGPILSPDGRFLGGSFHGDATTSVAVDAHRLFDVRTGRSIQLDAGGAGWTASGTDPSSPLLDLTEGARRALILEGGTSPRLLDVTVGTGDARVVPLGDVTPSAGRWLPDGHTLLACGAAPGEEERLYILGPDERVPRALTPPGVTGYSINPTYRGEWDARPSPDGRWVAVPEGRRIRLYSVAGTGSRDVAGEVGWDRLLGWTEDGGSLLLRRDPAAIAVPALLYRLEIASGRQHDWTRLVPGDRLGLLSIRSVSLGRHGRVQAFARPASLHTATIVDGLR